MKIRGDFITKSSLVSYILTVKEDLVKVLRGQVAYTLEKLLMSLEKKFVAEK